MIQAAGAELRYMDHGKEVFAVHGVDLEIAESEYCGILGPSGSGKSSLLYLLSGLKQPTAGQILYQGKDFARLPEAACAEIRLREFGFVFQHAYLLGYLSILENILVARPGEDRSEEAQSLLKSLGIAEKAHRLPHELSGGERQRACVARALLGRPKVIFADEPTASLDHANGLAVVQLLKEYRGEAAVVMVTHDESMLSGADRIIRIEDGRVA